MFIERADREELKALSKEVFGVPSRYQKFLDGVPELVTMTKTEEVPGENGAPTTTKETKVPVLTESGAKQYRTKYYTVEELKQFLRDLKKQREEIMAAIKQQQEEAEAKKAQTELQKKLHEDASGSAL